MASTPQFVYDQVPYEGFPITATHPDRIIPVARLLGLNPAPATNCRVLELGCGDGSNLIPMAEILTGSQFVGIDLAQNPVAKASAITRTRGLTNIRFQQMNVMDFDAGFGEFDYIFAHGLYSWVPAVVRDKIMSICQSHLSPNGVVYISYNVYPGCHLRKMMSGMMQYHAQGLDDPREKTAKALEILAFLSAGKPEAPALADELKQLKERRPYSILHDDLSEANNPVYFHEFAAHAGEHGLQFLAESDFFEMQPYNFPVEVRDSLTAFSNGDIIRHEQYLDFLKNRRFRKTLLCRQEVPINRTPASSPIRDFYISSVARPVSNDPDIRSNKEEEFRGTKGGALRTSHPGLKAAFVHLSRCWPEPISFGRLMDQIPDISGGHSEDSIGLFCDMLLRCFTAGMLDLHALPPSHTTTPGARPVAFPYARMQAENGEPAVCNLRHTTIELDPPSLHLLTLLDGSRDVESIQRHLAELGVTAANGQVVNRNEVEENIRKMARAALLMAVSGVGLPAE
jgi:methyltransferase-like protein/ubiquinone/menaquinone biosynthesis C-methylase UbiE